MPDAGAPACPHRCPMKVKNATATTLPFSRRRDCRQENQRTSARSQDMDVGNLNQKRPFVVGGMAWHGMAWHGRSLVLQCHTRIRREVVLRGGDF